MPILLLIASLLLGCATASPTPTTHSLAPGIYRVSDGSAVTKAQLWNDLDSARYVVVGETHTSEADHAVQLEVVRALAERGDVAIGMEMFQRPFQEPLDRWVAGEIDEPELLVATQWKERWNFDPGLYRPFWDFARERGIPLVALNARRELTKRIAKVGVDGLTAEERADLVELDLSSERYRNWMREVFEAHGAAMEPEAFERFFAAQVTWDETMADTAVRWGERHPGTTVVVLAGRGHVERGFGIPQRVRRRTNERVVTIVPVSGDIAPFEGLRDQEFADYVWVTR